MTQHTHGPWEYEVHELSEGYSAIVYDERGVAIADHLTEDRARLIAAAPVLLSALEDCVAFIKGDISGKSQHLGILLEATRATRLARCSSQVEEG